MPGFDFRGIDLSGITRNNANLDGATLTGVKMERVRANGATFKGAAMAGAKLTRGVFEGGDFSNAVLEGGDLCYANFKKVTAPGVRMHKVFATDFDCKDAIRGSGLDFSGAFCEGIKNPGGLSLPGGGKPGKPSRGIPGFQ